MSKPVVILLDPHGPAVRSAIQAECPAEVVLRMTASGDPAERHALVEDAEFFVGGITPIPATLIRAAPRLRLIHKWGIGVDKIDLAAARERSVPVAITAGANAVPVAEFTLLLVLAVLRRLPHREAQLRGGEWQRAREETRVQARQLRGKVVGLVGLGAIGREVARRLRAFDAAVRYYDVRRLAPDEERAREVRFQDLDPLLAEADVVSLHVPLVPSTRGLLSRERIARLRPGAVVINTARGELVDEAALYDALRSGHLSGAASDVFVDEPPGASPLLTLETFIATPHVAGQTVEGLRRMGEVTAENALLVLEGRAPRFAVAPPG